MAEPVDILVRQEKAHGVPSDRAVAVLRERLPDHEVRLGRTPAEERAYAETASVIVGIDVEASLLDRAEDLRLFACASAGIDHAPMDLLRERDVTVTNASGIHRSAAEHAVASMLAFARRLPGAWRRNQRREWRHPGAFDGLVGSTVTVVGMGTIGEQVVELLAGFDVETVGVRHTPGKGGPTDEVVGFGTDDFYAALGRTDYLALACQLSEETEGLIDRRAFRALPSHAVLVNVARGEVVDTGELLLALRDPAGTHIRGAALDVTDPEPLPDDHPLWGLENVLVTAHTAGNNPNYWGDLAEIVARNVRRAEETGSWDGLENQVYP